MRAYRADLSLKRLWPQGRGGGVRDQNVFSGRERVFGD